VHTLLAVLILFCTSSLLWANEAVLTGEVMADVLVKEVLTGEILTGKVQDKPPQKLPEETPARKIFPVKNRTVEWSLINLNVYASNDSFAAKNFLRNPFDMLINKEIFRETVSINLNDFLSGFRLDLGTAIKPFSFNYNRQDKWGFGLDIAHVDIMGNVSLSGNMLSLHETDGDKFGVGGAVFTDIGIPVFFHYDDFKIKIRPAVYLPMIYTEPNVSYRHISGADPETGSQWTRIVMNYDMRVYSIFDIQGMADGVISGDAWNILGTNLGYDFGLNIEYPWDDWINIGVDIVNIPLVKAKLYHCARFQGSAFLDTSKFDIVDLMNGEDIPDDAYGYTDFDDDSIQYFQDLDGKKIYRPFTMLFYADCRPFDSAPSVSLIPSLGFSVNRLYPRPGAVEGGLSARLDLSNFFITTLGINYNDRKWKNSIDFILNLRAFAVDFGISFQSPDFVKSFQGAGLGVNVGLKFGW